jgi:hypothetical protein
MTHLRVLGASAAAVALALAAPAAAHRSASGEDVQATLSARPSSDAAFVSHPRLRIRVRGRTVFDAPVPGCAVCRIDVGRDLHVVDLDGDGHLEVALVLRTGRGRCCSHLDVFRASGARYVASSRSFWGCKLAVRDLGDRTPRVVACDSRFSGRFAAAADSLEPIRIWRVVAGRFVLATRAHPGAIRDDAARAWRHVEVYRGHRDVRGVLAAWVADELMLGRADSAWARVGALRRAGALGAGAGYPATLRRQLAALGYGA